MRVSASFILIGGLLGALPALAENPVLRNPEVPCIDGNGTPGGSTVPCNIPNSRSITTTPRPPASYSQPNNRATSPSVVPPVGNQPNGPLDRRTTPGTPQTAPYGSLPDNATGRQ